MSDWLIVRIPFDDPQNPEIIEVLSNVPINWRDYLEKVTKNTKKPGRYLAANLLYKEGEAFYPKTRKRKYKKTLRESGD